ncbi:helix-turn-helix domain-containing protein [Pseudomonas oryzihabitans]|uniref:helix-turn-helix domain-containing protein n=1 Tax=Pseudomonas oryzihabitans TaxID=47885 RepID=UPI0028942DC8|nr:helix-turn-helix domain-containing protein [Pseudomonas oryzihabitans]MDT3722453.1 helix-turn-helix domain-containing protein [Pseudomonas oryzihabitans]
MLLHQAHYDDVGVHASALVGWRQVYDQLSKGHARTTLRHLTAERFQLFQEILNTRVTQRGVAPAGRLCVALPLCAAEPGVFQGRSVGEENITLLYGGQEFSVQAASGLDLLAITVDERRLEAVAEREFSSLELRRLARLSRLALGPPQAQRMRQHFAGLLQYGLSTSPLSSERHLEDQVLEGLLDLLRGAIGRETVRQGNHAVSAYLVRQSQELTLASPDEPLSVLDICARLNVSRSTLQRSFQSVTGLRPVEYLRAIRLNAARRTLRTSRADHLTIAHVASDHGFVHLGHFAGYYRTLFGEHPSNTPRAS